jgi:hypothetical protein
VEIFHKRFILLITETEVRVNLIRLIVAQQRNRAAILTASDGGSTPSQGTCALFG